jgi:hypothetical protein
VVQFHELELHRPEQVLGLVQQPLVDVCVNGLLNTVQFYATTDSEVEVARCYFEAARAARKGGVDPEATAYKLDKMIWLLCTSDFYLEGGLKLFSTNALVESNLSAYSGDGI